MAQTTNGAVGNYSHREGTDTVSYGINSHAEGNNTQSIGENSHAEGKDTTALGNDSHAEGSGTLAKGVSSHAEGKLNQALGDYSHAQNGNNSVNNPTKAGGMSSHTEGAGTRTGRFSSYPSNPFENDIWLDDDSGRWAHAEGNNTVAIGPASHAEGIQTVAIGSYSHAEGSTTTAQNSYSHAAGFNNIGTSPDTIHETGIGSLFVPKNAFEIYTDGTLTAPECTNALIDSRGLKTLITKEYLAGYSVVANLDDLADVIITNEQTNDCLKFDGTNWINQTPAAINVPTELSDLDDVDTSGGASGQVLSFDGTTWVPVTASGGASELEKVDDGNGDSWRLLGVPTSNKGNIGSASVDFSTAYDDWGPSEGAIWGTTGSWAIAAGYDVKAGDFAAAFGAGNQATGEGSFVAGQYNKALGNRSTAFGEYAIADGVGSFAVGDSAEAYGSHSQAMGNSTTTIADYSMSIGNSTSTTASADSSLASGVNTIANNEGMFVTGFYNTSNLDTVLEVGVGTNIAGTITRKNALSVFLDGTIIAPELTTALITDPKSLVTKEYADSLGGGSTSRLEIDFDSVIGDDVFSISGVHLSAFVYIAGMKSRRNTFTITNDGTNTTVTLNTPLAIASWVSIEY